MNTDISGIGVRISYYLQTLFLGCLSARSGSLEEITGALYTLIATNMAIAVTSLILGLKPKPEMSLQDALVVFYLLTLSWCTVLWSLGSCSRFSNGTKVLRALSDLQSYIIFAFAFAILIKAHKFGSSPECNGNAVLVILGRISALKAGRILGWIVIIIVTASYTLMTVRDYVPVPMLTRGRIVIGIPAKIEVKPESPLPLSSHLPQTSNLPNLTHIKTPEAVVPYKLPIDGKLIIMILFILLFWAFAVLNTELLIIWNHFEQSDNSQSAWQFGQVLPMFLVVLPLVNMIGAFKKYKLKRLRPVAQTVQVLIA